MLAIDVHCRVGGPTSLLPTAQGNDVECCHVNVAVHFLDILISSLKQKWQDIPGLSAIHSVLELARHRLYFMSLFV